MNEFTIVCPYCGEIVEIFVEEEVSGRFVQDCEVCCNPWLVRIHGSGDDRGIEITKADGSE